MVPPVLNYPVERLNSISSMLTKIGAALVLPPLSFLLLCALGLALAWRGRRAGFWLVAASITGLYLVSSPYFAGALLRTIEPEKTLPSVSELSRAGAIVVLGGGTYFHAPEYGADTAGSATLERIRYAARLHRRIALPLLVSGGSPLASDLSEAQQMRAALEEDFAVPVKWLEDRADNTFQSALLTKSILQQDAIERIVLVTHAAHMRRARLAFERAGLEVIAAATGYTTSRPHTLTSFMPSAEGLAMAHTFFHETIGLGWYHLRFASGWRQDSER